MAELLGEDGAEDGADKGLTGLCAARQEVDGLKVLVGLGLHRADHGELIGDLGAVGHELAELDTGELGGNGAEGPPKDTAGLGVPGLELARSPTEPEEDTVLALLFGLLGERGGGKETGPAQNRGRSRAHKPLQEQPPVERVLWRGTDRIGFCVVVHLSGLPGIPRW